MKIYEKPTVDITEISSSDVVTLSIGDTEYDENEW